LRYHGMKAFLQLAGPRLRELREAHDLSQAALGKLIGVPQVTISRLEDGHGVRLTELQITKLYQAVGEDPPSELAEKVDFICSNFLCPVAYWERSGGVFRAIPNWIEWPEGKDCFCGFCSKPQFSHCQECKKPITTGQAICNFCGKPYCKPPRKFGNDDHLEHNLTRQAILNLKRRNELKMSESS
jgi:transcriptional regulator with XRE-family HTH domain